MAITPDIQKTLVLIPPPNNLQPNFMAWVASLAMPYVNVMTAINNLIAAFNIQTASGNQLNIIGQLLGVGRVVNFVPSLPGDSATLSDSNYRIVLIAKIIQNQWDGTIPQIYAFWYQYFPGQPIFIQDNQDMSMTVWVLGMAPGIQQDLVANGYFVPKPAGVRINYIFGEAPVFGFDIENQYIQGFDEGKWANFSTSF